MAEWNYTAWAETQGIENLKARIANGDHLLQQANNLLNVMLAVLAGLCAYGTRVLGESSSPLAWGCLIGAVWSFGVLLVLSHHCIATRDTQVPHNEPTNIYKPELGLTQTQILEYQLKNLQAQIELTKQRNAHVATWLDRSRYAAIGTSVVVAIASLLAYQLAWVAHSLSALGA